MMRGCAGAKPPLLKYFSKYTFIFLKKKFIKYSSVLINCENKPDPQNIL
jgi:hypothetical protein